MRSPLASGAHRGRTGVSSLQPLVAVGRCWLRAVASGSRNSGSGNSAVTFTARVVFLTFPAVAVSHSVSQSVAAIGERRRKS